MTIEQACSCVIHVLYTDADVAADLEGFAAE